MPSIGGASGHGPVTYNGHSFSERMQILLCDGRPRYDSAERTVVAMIWTIQIKDTINAASSTNDSMESIKQKLTVPGKVFTFSSVGIGDDFLINTGTVKDINWGPKPRFLSWRPYGKLACDIVWEVQVEIPECSNASYSGVISEFNFTLETSIDRAGWTVRTYKGHFRIPQTRNGTSRVLQETADDFWESIQIEIPVGFRLGQRSRELDESRCRCDWVIVHEECGPNYLPPGVVSATASHDIETTNRAFAQWAGIIYVDYEFTRDFVKENAWAYFFEFCKRRIDWMTSNGSGPVQRNAAPSNSTAGQVGGFVSGFAGGFASMVSGGLLSPNPAANTGQAAPPSPAYGFVIPTKITAAEVDVYGPPKARFSLQYLFTQPIGNIVKSSGLFLPTDSDSLRAYQLWRESMLGNAWHPLGNAKLRFNAQDDIIVDPCLSAEAIDLSTGVARSIASRRTDIQRGLDLRCPKPENSWIHYENRLEIEVDNDIIEAHPLPIIDNTNGSIFEGNSDNAIQPPTAAGGYTSRDGKVFPPSIVYKRTSNSNAVYLVGKALRACYDIPPPVLKQIAGVEPIQACRQEMGEKFQTWVFCDLGRVVMAAYWRIRYIVPSNPGQVLRVSTQGDRSIRGSGVLTDPPGSLQATGPLSPR